MLEWTAASPYRPLELAVHHTDGEREFAYDSDPLLGSGTGQLTPGNGNGVSLDGGRHGGRLVERLPITWSSPISGEMEAALRRSTSRPNPQKAKQGNSHLSADDARCLVILHVSTIVKSRPFPNRAPHRSRSARTHRPIGVSSIDDVGPKRSFP
jgi:hypothetical protein